MSIDQDVESDVPPDCTVQYDDCAGCGVNVEYVQHGQTPFVVLSFMTQFGESGVHDLTLAQVDQLRAALDAVGKVARAVAVVQQQPAA